MCYCDGDCRAPKRTEQSNNFTFEKNQKCQQALRKTRGTLVVLSASSFYSAVKRHPASSPGSGHAGPANSWFEPHRGPDWAQNSTGKKTKPRRDEGRQRTWTRRSSSWTCLPNKPLPPQWQRWCHQAPQPSQDGARDSLSRDWSRFCHQPVTPRLTWAGVCLGRKWKTDFTWVLHVHVHYV